MSTPKLAPAAREPTLVAGLRSPLCYPHPVERVVVLETHISWVLLAGAFAYKVKKPVALGFLDFSTLAARRHFCEEELRLNRRTAPALYMDVVAISGSAAAPVVGGEGDPIEFAVRMRRFAQPDLLDERARSGMLRPADIDALAASIADFHGRAARAPPGVAGDERALAMDNLQVLGQLEPGTLRHALPDLAHWTSREHHAVAAAIAQRRVDGHVRECHGDLHLGNLVMLGGKPVAFDCIEFDPALRWIDVMSDVAFVAMDLHHHGLRGLAARFLDAYLAHTGDYEGLAVLRFYTVYRALVRAKVCAIRAAQEAPGSGAAAHTREQIDSFVRLAVLLSARPPPTLTLMHGLSGSGKSTVSQGLVETQGAIRLRSDVERKRGVATGTLTPAPPGEGRYAPSERARVYDRLLALAGTALAAGYPVIVDAAFLERAQRTRFRELARATGCELRIVSCEAPAAVLRARVAGRSAAGTDASEAGVAVLEAQLSSHEPLAGDELALRRVIDTTKEATP